MEKEKEFETFFKAHYQHALHFARQFMPGDDETCRDIVEDSFEILWKRFDDVVPDSRVAFVFRLVRCKCADHTRHSKTASLFVQRYLHEHAEGFDPLASDPREERIRLIAKLMEQLTPRTRQILTECYFNHRSYAEVTAMLGVSASTVKKHIMQALKFFRENMVKENKKRRGGGDLRNSQND